MIEKVFNYLFVVVASIMMGIYIVGIPLMCYDVTHGGKIEKFIERMDRPNMDVVNVNDYIVKTVPKVLIGAVCAGGIVVVGVLVLIAVNESRYKTPRN